VFAVSTDGVFATAATANLVVDKALGTQAAQLSIDLGTGTVTVTNPPNFALAATAVINDAENTVTIDVDLTNNACRAVHNAKLVVDAINEGGASAAGDVTFDGKAALTYGPAAIAELGTRSSQLVVSNVTGAVDPLVVDASVIDHPTLVFSGGYDDAARVMDSSGVGGEARANLQPFSFREGFDSTTYPGAISPDGELLYLGHGQQPAVMTLDLTTLTVMAGTDLTGADNIAFDGTGSLGYVGSVTMSPDFQHLYAVMVTNEHRAYFADTSCTTSCDMEGRIADITNNPADVVLIRLDRETMEEVDRITLIDDSLVRPKAGPLQMSADGSLAVLPIRREGKIFLLDLDAMAIVDADTDTAGEQAFDTSASSTEPHLAALAADGSAIYVAYRGDGRNGPSHDETLDVIEAATGNVTTLAPGTPTATTDNRTGFLRFGPDGRLYYGRKAVDGVNVSVLGVSIFDVSTPAEVHHHDLESVNALVFAPDGQSYYVWKRSGGVVSKFDIGTDAAATFVGLGTETASFGDGFGHIGLCTPL
jgi:hypothetical protein